MEDIKITADKDLYSATEVNLPEDWHSETRTIESSLHRGYFENGRSFLPSDEQQFDAYESGHITAFLVERHQSNPFFRSPVGAGLKHVLDIGTGKGSWAIDVADMFPNAIVRGVDLFPPPVSWMPPNCVLEVDDVLQEWTWQQPFDLIHMRILEGAFTHEESNRLYKQCYESLRPGGWIELLELTPDLQSEDNNWPQDCQLKEWYPLMRSAAEKSGRPLDLYDRCTDLVRDTGFVDIHEEIRKWPIGPWPRDKQLKEIGTVNLEHWLAGLEGYGMYLLTKFGVPKPWSKDEVQVWLAQIRNELRNTNYHTCHRVKRVWARKPFVDEVVLASVEGEH
ncbi:hypothetical protein N7541_005320 [Penicillium brevicompactum]|uniref:Uncharacterized protein n=1 Tax=Penicillium brevicompactum TaxID=5074 RepID=A0A9W9RDA9_PENBR|nr:hypothetical protein N7541_005320 [Penicillium brevicompactum]